MKKIGILLFITIGLVVFNFFVFDRPDSRYVEKIAFQGVADAVDVDLHKVGKVLVSGEWEVYDSRLLGPGDISSNDLEQSIESVPMPDGGNGYVTARLVIKATDYKSYRLTVFPYNSYFRLWLNGRNVYGGQLENKDLLNDSRLRDVDMDSSYFSWDCSSVDGKIEVLMQLSSNSLRNGISTTIQDSALAQKRRETRLVVFAALVGGILMIGGFFLNYYLINRRNKLVLYLGLMCIASSLSVALNYLDYSIGQALGFHFSYEMLKYLRRLPQAAMLVLGAMFTNTLYARDALKPVNWILNGMLLLWVSTATVLFGLGSYEDMLKVVSYGNIVVLGYLCYYIAVMGRALLHHRSGASEFLFSFIVAGMAGVHDALLGMGILSTVNILFYYGILVLILTMSTYLSRSFNVTLSELEATAASLNRSHDDMKAKNEELAGMWQQVVHSRNALARLNEDLEEIVEKRTSTIRNLFHNAGQGFLSIDRNLMVHDEYSRECERIFQCEIKQSYLPDLLYMENEGEKESFRKIVDKAMETKNRREVYLSLLPSEVEIKGRHIFIEYKMISLSQAESGRSTDDEELMLILTDVTEKHELEKQLEGKRKSLEMVVKVIINRNDFEECIKDYRIFCKKHFSEIIASDSSDEKKAAEILRFIHNLKGNFSQFELVNLVGKLHNLEDRLINSSMFEFNMTSIKELIDTEIMLSWLEDELDGLEKILGSEFFSKRNLVTVKMDKLVELEKIVMENLSEDKQKLLLPKLRRLRYKPLGEMLRVYEGYVTRLSEQLEKPVNCEFKCDDVMVDTSKYHGFTRSLVHVYRNVMDHGIESGEERMENGKDELGTVSTSLIRSNESVIIRISDDGGGLDTVRIAEKAVEKGIYDEEQIELLSENEIHRLIFSEEFSTKEQATQLSGRGVGLSAVLYEVDKLGGYVSVESTAGAGTTFEFYFLESGEA